jgi:hypothetical protein
LIDNELNSIYEEVVKETELRLPEEVRQKLTKKTPYPRTVIASDSQNRVISSSSRHFEIE